MTDSALGRFQLIAGIGYTEWRIRQQPSLDAQEIDWIVAGDVVVVKAHLGDWLSVSVEHSGIEGWTLGVANGRQCFTPVLAKGKNWAILVCGGTRGAYYGTPERPWRDLGGEIALLITLGHVYAQMACELGPEHVIVIAGMESAREWLRGMAAHGYSKPHDAQHVESSKMFYSKAFNGDLEQSRRTWQSRLDELEKACRVLIENGGADYDGSAVNPTTILHVLSGDAKSGIGSGGRVLPSEGVASLFFWVTTHGSAHPISIGSRETAGKEEPVPIHDREVCEESDSLDANEWFWVMPHQATDLNPYAYVRLAGYTLDTKADPAAAHAHLPLYVVYWQQVFAVLHRTMQLNPDRRVVAFYQFCLSGGHISFLQRPAIRQHWGVDRWPMYMIASSSANQNSLGATLTVIFIELLQSRMRSRMTLGQFFKELDTLYWQRHRRVAEMNQHLPKHMRLGEMQQYHTPDSGIESTLVSDVFANAGRRKRYRMEASEAPLSRPKHSCGEAASPAVGESEPRAQLLGMLVDMGFPITAVEAALREASWRPDLAIDLLLSK